MALILSGGDTEKDLQVKQSEVNHMRLVLAWMRCEFGQTPEEFLETVRQIAPSFTDEISDEAKARLVQSYDNKMRIPKYIRHSVNMLTKMIDEHDKRGGIVDGEVLKNRLEGK